jgi:hypothetical protein
MFKANTTCNQIPNEERYPNGDVLRELRARAIVARCQSRKRPCQRGARSWRS